MKNAETPRSPWQEKGWRMRKEETLSAKERSPFYFSSDQRSDKPKYFLLLAEGTMRPSLDDTLANLSTCSSRLFY